MCCDGISEMKPKIDQNMSGTQIQWIALLV